ncbi:MAG: glycosyltransferase [Chloroflexota bacterium]
MSIAAELTQSKQRVEDDVRTAVRCSIGIMAYNEEANICRLLDRLLHQRLTTVEIAEIIVAASGCTDRTEDIVREATSG